MMIMIRAKAKTRQIGGESAETYMLDTCKNNIIIYPDGICIIDFFGNFFSDSFMENTERTLKIIFKDIMVLRCGNIYRVQKEDEDGILHPITREQVETFFELLTHPDMHINTSRYA